jgi:hypothetical protein
VGETSHSRTSSRIVGRGRTLVPPRRGEIGRATVAALTVPGSAEDHEGFPTTYERGALIDWAKEHIGHYEAPLPFGRGRASASGSISRTAVPKMTFTPPSSVSGTCQSQKPVRLRSVRLK